MSISAIGFHTSTLQPAKAPESAEGPGPDHDGDADDKGVTSAASGSAAPLTPGGMGLAVNTKA